MDNCDESDMVYCPYNKEHKMLRKKLQQHILKCRVIYKDTVELMVCPFNKSHLIPEPEFFQHTKSCEDRNIIVHYQTSEPAVLSEDTRHPTIESEENWDDDDSVPDYDPHVYCSTAKIVRDPNGLFPAQRKAFIEQEKRRHFGEDYKEEKPPKAKFRADPRPTPYESSRPFSRRQ